MPKHTTVDISMEAFARYLNCQYSGATNMYSPNVQDLADLSRDEHLTILDQYDALKTKFHLIKCSMCGRYHSDGTANNCK